MLISGMPGREGRRLLAADSHADAACRCSLLMPWREGRRLLTLCSAADRCSSLRCLVLFCRLSAHSCALWRADADLWDARREGRRLLTAYSHADAACRCSLVMPWREGRRLLTLCSLADRCSSLGCLVLFCMLSAHSCALWRADADLWDARREGRRRQEEGASLQRQGRRLQGQAAAGQPRLSTAAP